MELDNIQHSGIRVKINNQAEDQENGLKSFFRATMKVLSKATGSEPSKAEEKSNQIWISSPETIQDVFSQAQEIESGSHRWKIVEINGRKVRIRELG